VNVTLTGTDTSNNAVSKTTTTNSTGAYSFSNLAPGTYTITQATLPFLQATTTSAGSQGSTTTTSNSITTTIADDTTGTANNFTTPGRETQFVDLRDFIASRSRSYEIVAVNPTSGLVWATPGTGWSNTQTSITFSSDKISLVINATQTTTPSGGGSPTSTNVSVTVAISNATLIQSYGTDSSGNQLFKLLGPSSAFNFQATSSGGNNTPGS
jgi:hypothetical protein